MAIRTYHTFALAASLALGTAAGFAAEPPAPAPGTIITVAGIGPAPASSNPHVTGDGGPAAQAQISFPRSVAADGAGDLFIVGHGLRKVGPDGTIVTVARGPIDLSIGGGPITASRLWFLPSGLALDGSGGVLIADPVDERLLRLAPSGTLSTIAGDGRPYAGSFLGDGGPASDAALNSPQSVSVGPDGSIYVMDAGNERIRRIDRAGIITTIAGGAGMHAPSGDGGPALSAHVFAFDRPAADYAGNVYFGDYDDDRVRVISPDGFINAFAGTGVRGFSGDGGRAIDAQLDRPAGVVLDPDGNLFVADSSNQRVREIDTRGIITTVAGTGLPAPTGQGVLGGFSGDGGPATQSRLNLPSDLALDGRGNLFIADANNERVREVFGVATPDPVAGDLNGDGRVTVADADVALRIAVGLVAPTPLQIVAGDVNGNGRIDTADATAILREAVGLSG